ncbi:hypothetical protein [Phaeovulum sp.]|uniref:hypothetical protein n=1 Tax=Phaeovulum sp. TaxID=2934796 RepID=UPI003564C22D
MHATVPQKHTMLLAFFAPELRAWRGQMPLPVVFWGYGVGTSIVLAILHATALDAGQLLFQQALILISAAYTIWILVAIWRCAAKARALWGVLARWLTVTWGLNTAFVLLFLQIELLARYVRG